MVHGDFSHVIAGGDGFRRQTFALSPKDDGQARNGVQKWGCDREGVVGQCHSHSLKPKRMEGGDGVVYPCPRHKEHCAHRHADCPAVERVAGIGGEQYGIYAQCGCRAEDGADIGGVHHVINHRHACGFFCDCFCFGNDGAPHGAKHTAGECVASEGAQRLPVAGEDGSVRWESVNDVAGIAGDMSSLAKQG